MGCRKLRLRLFTFAAGVTAVLGFAAVPAAEAATSAPHSNNTASSLPYGLYQNGNDLQYSIDGSVPEYGIKYLGWDSNGTEPFDVTTANAAYNNGVEPFLELQPCTSPCNASGGGYSLVDIANGVYDSSLSAFNSSVAAWGHPLLLTFGHEMNGNWYPWGYQSFTPAQWIAAWDHVTSIINAPNVTWVWAPNINTSAYHPLSAYWPGSRHVGMCGLDGYLSNSTDTWSNTIAPSVAALQSVCRWKPWILAETGVNDTDANAVSQIDDLVDGATWSGADALMYFNKYNWLLTPDMESEFLSDVAGS